PADHANRCQFPDGTGVPWRLLVCLSEVFFGQWQVPVETCVEAEQEMDVGPRPGIVGPGAEQSDPFLSIATAGAARVGSRLAIAVSGARARVHHLNEKPS